MPPPNGMMPPDKYNLPDLGRLRVETLLKEKIPLVTKCPNGCEPSMVLNALSRDLTKSSFARCLLCGLFWEVTPENKVVRIKQWKDESVPVLKVEDKI